jgi:hypothetical protein
MADNSYELDRVPVFECAVEGPGVRDERDATDLIATAWENRAAMVVIPVERLENRFFDLGTGVAGGIIQSFANYRMRVAILGDISARMARSTALLDLVREANRGDQLWFVATRQELAQRLGMRSGV